MCTMTERLNNTLHLEEAAQPPDLEGRLADNKANDEDVPPLDTGVCGLGGVTMGALAHNYILLLILDLGQEIGEFTD